MKAQVNFDALGGGGTKLEYNPTQGINTLNVSTDGITSPLTIKTADVSTGELQAGAGTFVSPVSAYVDLTNIDAISAIITRKGNVTKEGALSVTSLTGYYYVICSYLTDSSHNEVFLSVNPSNVAKVTDNTRYNKLFTDTSATNSVVINSIIAK